jgi:hypothetical protein
VNPLKQRIAFSISRSLFGLENKSEKLVQHKTYGDGKEANGNKLIFESLAASLLREKIFEASSKNVCDCADN